MSRSHHSFSFQKPTQIQFIRHKSNLEADSGQRSLKTISIEMGNREADARRLQNNKRIRKRNAVRAAIVKCLTPAWAGGNQSSWRVCQEVCQQLHRKLSFIQKYNVYLTPVPALASQCLAINTKAQIKLLDSTLKKAMLQRTIALLNATNQRKLYNYQNNCMSLVCSLLSEPGECFADLLDIH